VADTVLCRGLQTRPIIIQIVEIRSVDDLRDTELGSLGGAYLIQVVLAEVAAVGGIGGLIGDVQLIGVDDDVARTKITRQPRRHLIILVRRRRRTDGQRHGVVLQFVDRNAQKKRRVDAAGESHQCPLHLPENGAQMLQLRRRHIPSAWKVSASFRSGVRFNRTTGVDPTRSRHDSAIVGIIEVVLTRECGQNNGEVAPSQLSFCGDVCRNIVALK
jgi:hypothetical protein